MATQDVEPIDQVKTENEKGSYRDKAKTWAQRWLFALILTLIILSVAGRVIWPQYVNCWDAWTSWPTPIERLLSWPFPPSGCMTPNEIGDFLAGVFAPVAFIWLSFAVILQSKELREQRRELELTRSVAKEQKEAISAQAEEAKRSGNYFAKQTQIFEAEQNQRDQAQADGKFRAYSLRLYEIAEGIFLNRKDRYGKQIANAKFKLINKETGESGLLSLREVQSFIRLLRTGDGLIHEELLAVDRLVSDLCDMHNEASKNLPAMSEAMRVTYNARSFEEMGKLLLALQLDLIELTKEK